MTRHLLPWAWLASSHFYVSCNKFIAAFVLWLTKCMSKGDQKRVPLIESQLYQSSTYARHLKSTLDTDLPQREHTIHLAFFWQDDFPSTTWWIERQGIFKCIFYIFWPNVVFVSIISFIAVAIWQVIRVVFLHKLLSEQKRIFCLVHLQSLVTSRYFFIFEGKKNCKKRTD